MALSIGTVIAADRPKPWRFANEPSSAGWLSVGGNYRVRYETLDHPFRAGASGSDEILVARLVVNARINFDHFFAGLELEDSRQQLADSGTPLGTDIVNSFEPLQALVGMRFADAFSTGDRLDVALGRSTIDAGSRRLIARNSFRNTINAFSGLHATWQGSDGSDVQALFVQPVQRKPSDFTSLKNNDNELDTQSGDVRLWGLFGSRPRIFGNVTGDAYFYGFRSRDHIGIPAADRDLYTPGVRLYKKPAGTGWDFEAEGAYQFGTSRASTAAADRRDLQHRAWFVHGEVGYTLKASMSPRFEISYDYASGDHRPTDNENNRFDTLFGARRFDFGPTGIYGAFARSNISTPGVRVELKPSAAISAMVGYRAVWLASDRDQFTTARLQDPTGNSGSFVGNQPKCSFSSTCCREPSHSNSAAPISRTESFSNARQTRRTKATQSICMVQ
jgi:hypothetical protein